MHKTKVQTICCSIFTVVELKKSINHTDLTLQQWKKYGKPQLVDNLQRCPCHKYATEKKKFRMNYNRTKKWVSKTIGRKTIEKGKAIEDLSIAIATAIYICRVAWTSDQQTNTKGGWPLKRNINKCRQLY